MGVVSSPSSLPVMLVLLDRVGEGTKYSEERGVCPVFKSSCYLYLLLYYIMFKRTVHLYLKGV